MVVNPNMSYCAFENTKSAIEQLIDIVSVAVDEGSTLVFSDYEHRAYNRLRGAMSVLAELMDCYDEAEEEQLIEED